MSQQTAPKLGDDARLQRVCEAIVRESEPGTGFIIFTFPFGSESGQRLRYASNAQRADVVTLLKQWLTVAENPELWMKHTP